METYFYNNAKDWVNSSQKSLNENKYLLSWVKTAPARVNFLLDLICNFIKAPFNLLYFTFGGIRAGYSWGNETKWLENGANNLYHNANDSISDVVGMIATKKGCDIRDNNNVVVLMGSGLLIGAIGLQYYILSKADILTIRYNSETGSYEPLITWNKK